MKVDKEFLKSELKKQVTEERYFHSLGVAETAKQLAQSVGEDSEKAEIAGILHDFTKYWPKEELIKIINNSFELSNDMLNYSVELWHGPVASVVIKDKFSINDDLIIQAIRYHTSGRENMSTFEKIICLADYIEPSRDFPGVEKIRGLAEKDLDSALLMAFDSTIKYLIDDKKTIYPLTLKARNYLLNQYLLRKRP